MPGRAKKDARKETVEVRDVGVEHNKGRFLRLYGAVERSVCRCCQVTSRAHTNSVPGIIYVGAARKSQKAREAIFKI